MKTCPVDSGNMVNSCVLRKRTEETPDFLFFKASIVIPGFKKKQKKKHTKWWELLSHRGRFRTLEHETGKKEARDEMRR